MVSVGVRLSGSDGSGVATHRSAVSPSPSSISRAPVARMSARYGSHSPAGATGRPSVTTPNRPAVCGVCTSISLDRRRRSISSVVIERSAVAMSLTVSTDRGSRPGAG